MASVTLLHDRLTFKSIEGERRGCSANNVTILKFFVPKIVLFCKFTKLLQKHEFSPEGVLIMTHFQFCLFLLWQHFEFQRRLKGSGFDGSSERDCQFEAVFNIFDTSGGPASTLLYFRLVDQNYCEMGQF